MCSVSHCAVMLLLLTDKVVVARCRYRDLDRRDFQRIEHLLRKVRVVLSSALPPACPSIPCSLLCRNKRRKSRRHSSIGG